VTGGIDSAARPFDVWDISDWAVMSQEARGLDPKDWVVPAGDVAIAGQKHWWLYKPIKRASYRRYDDWAEKLTCELALLLDVPCAQVELACRLSDQGIISANVTPNGWSMESGDTMLSECPGYLSCAGDDRPKNRIGHNLDNIKRVLEGCGGPPGSACADWTGAEVFAGDLLLDAWVANTDRHAINWAVLTREEDGKQALAASFDHGTALGSGVQDQQLRRLKVEDFAHRGFASRFEDGARLPLTDLARQGICLIGGQAERWLDRLAAVREAAVDEIVGSIPGMSEVRHKFISSLLMTNQGRMTS